MSHTKEDWERVHLMDSIYMRELEFEEKEYFETQKPAKINIMGEVEFGKCDFCKKEKPIERTYLYPSKYNKSKVLEDRANLYNEGNYFHYLSTCTDCGIPETHKKQETVS